MRGGRGGAGLLRGGAEDANTAGEREGGMWKGVEGSKGETGGAEGDGDGRGKEGG